MMGLVSHISCLSKTISSFHVSFSLMKRVTMIILGRVHLVRALFHYSLKILLVVSVEYFLLVMSVEY